MSDFQFACVCVVICFWIWGILEVIVELRGGVPERCDFCSKPFTEQNYATPEEAGDWACIECVRRWDKEDKEKNT